MTTNKLNPVLRVNSAVPHDVATLWADKFGIGAHPAFPAARPVTGRLLHLGAIKRAKGFHSDQYWKLCPHPHVLLTLGLLNLNPLASRVSR
jgi:hypothetical protein